MGDARFAHAYERVRDSADPGITIQGLGDEAVIEALAAASREGDPYLANVLATEALNRTRRARVRGERLGAVVAAAVASVIVGVFAIHPRNFDDYLILEAVTFVLVLLVALTFLRALGAAGLRLPRLPLRPRAKRP